MQWIAALLAGMVFFSLQIYASLPNKYWASLARALKMPKYV
jgi:hypothetical protein